MPATDGKPKHTVLVIDDHPLALEWLSNLINQQPDLEVCGETADKAHALELIATVKPEVALVDISLEGPSGIGLIKNIKAMALDVAIVVLSVHDDVFYAQRALRAGARGYVMKGEITEKVLHAIRTVLDGKFYLSEPIAMTMAEKLVEGSGGASSVESLSNRELEVFRLLGRGYGTRQIAENLNVSTKTVQAFYARIKEKLDVARGTELLREAVRWNDRQN